LRAINDNSKMALMHFIMQVKDKNFIPEITINLLIAKVVMSINVKISPKIRISQKRKTRKNSLFLVRHSL
jgi:hypothetical protein